MESSARTIQEFSWEVLSNTMVPFHDMGVIIGLNNVRIFFETFIDPAHRALKNDGQVERNKSKCYDQKNHDY